VRTGAADAWPTAPTHEATRAAATTRARRRTD